MRLNNEKILGIIALSILGRYMVTPYYGTYHFSLLLVMYIIVALIVYVFIFEVNRR